MAAKRALRYLAGSIDVGITYGGPTATTVEELGPVWSDANWVTVGESRATSGYVLKMNGGPVVWGSKRQAVHALSTAEAEFYAMGGAVVETLAMRNFLFEIGLEQTGGTTVRCDNRAAIAAVYNGTSKMRHIELRHDFINYHLHKGHIDIQWVPGEEQQADIFTKALGIEPFMKMRRRMMG